MKTKKIKLVIFSCIFILSMLMVRKTMNHNENGNLTLKNLFVIAHVYAEDPPSGPCGCYVCSPYHEYNACYLDCQWWKGWKCG